MTKDRCMWFAYGVAIGAAAGLLFAPKSGERTRALIAAKAKEGRLMLKERTAEVRGTVTDTIQRGTDAAQRVTKGLAAAMAAGKRTMAR